MVVSKKMENSNGFCNQLTKISFNWRLKAATFVNNNTSENYYIRSIRPDTELIGKMLHFFK